MVHIGHQDKTRGEVCRILNTVLADEFVLSTRTRNYYWNVTGSHFQDCARSSGISTESWTT
jgi:starvation-inducible DNA-binding protein